ncbi:hypothetical protein NC796_12070 [Aliifodinibius sp. S!AR15-10]|uniref:hypothetical protein n=1 Tax=Aliifodinibius sp. S!AR15-10 TaxID=2950437 RepID=UPI002864CDBC|nr:hypothetical protein [Aliifodinibius sp. S!AR15-10]MDR8391885.1 hypothetical protein [Aliifodinibius sp. S!AR15-10]
MPSFQENQKNIAKARARLEKAEQQLYEARLKVQRAKSPETVASISRELTAVNQTFANAQASLSKAILKLYRQHDFKSAVSELDAQIPVLLLPVRLETRFVDTDVGSELWIRIYPDDIHIHSFEPMLTDAEWEAGTAYWRLLLKANREEGEAKEEIKKEEWTKLNEKLGVQRSLWVTKQTTPQNWEPDLAVEDDALEFPEHPETKTHDWTRAPRTQILPDMFVVNIHRDGKIVHSEISNNIPDTVFLGPDPFQAEEAFKEENKEIKFHEDFSWTSDFEKAVEQGLGVKITVSDSFFNGGRIERISVMGLMASTGPDESKQMLEEHLHAHHYSSRGFSFLPQGSPTNNTDQSGSAYTQNHDYLPKGYYDGTPFEDLDSKPRADVHEFARALGIGTDLMDEVNHAGKEEVAEAQAMNKALYPATIGYYLEVLTNPAVSKSAQPKVRDFFTEHVSATGPLPTIRVGDQPYGILLASDISKWEEPAGDSFDKGLTLVLKILQSRWNTMMRNKVAHVGKAGDPSKILLEILGLSAGSVSFKQRLGHLPDFHFSLAQFANIESSVVNKQATIVNLLKETGFEGSENSFPLISNLLFYDKDSSIPYNYMVDRKPPSPTRFLDKLGDTKKNFIEWLAGVTKVKDIDDHAAGAQPPRSVLYLLLRHALLLELQRAASDFYTKNGYTFDRGANEKSLYNFNTEVKDLTTWEVLYGIPQKVDLQKLKVSSPIGDHLLDPTLADTAAEYIKEMRSALNLLADLPTARLHQLLSDHIDLCSYRLDAWQTGLFYRRLKQSRSEKPSGVYLGAYGWVENLSKQPKLKATVPKSLSPEDGKPVFESAANAGFVHTPSLNHATAAGVLHAGYVHHASRTSPNSFAVNLSSERVRRALFVYEGIQNNQLIEALLGYQFERALHDITSKKPDQNLNRYILDFREKYPIENNAIPQQGLSAQETVPAHSVVNGLKLVDAKPSDFNSVVTNSADRDLILKERDRLADTLDALADLLTSETAFQMVQGKTERTAAVLNSMKDADLPPELEVNKTPRSTHLTYTNRVSIHFDSDANIAENSGWAQDPTPRSGMEPGLNHWLAQLIGDPKKIMCNASLVDEEGNETDKREIALAAIDLQPIDLVYSVGIDVQTGAKELEQLVHRNYKAQVDIPEGARVRIAFDPEGLDSDQMSFAQLLPLLQSLRLLITTARPASAKDYLPKSKSIIEDADAQFGWDHEELRGRVDSRIVDLKNELSTVNAQAPNGIQPKTDTNPATLKLLFEHYFAEGRPVERLEQTRIMPSAIDTLLALVASAPRYGIKCLYPERVDADNQATVTELLATAAEVWRQVNKKLAQAEQKMAAADTENKIDTKVTRLTDTAKAILGDDFVVLPRFRFKNSEDLSSSISEAGAQLLKYFNGKYNTSSELAVETWMESVAAVRPNMDRLERLRIISEFQSGNELNFTAAQVPFQENDSWLAVEFPAEDEETGEPFDIKHDTIALCVQGLDANSIEESQSALIIDDWTESVPMDREITGISYNYNQPNATAPNALLLAVEPTGADNWNWDRLVDILNDTLQRAKTRAVEPAHLLEDSALDILSPMTIASFDLDNSNISLDYLITNDELVQQMKAHKYELYTKFDLKS